MKVIVCVEDRGGMTFNKRRVSRDRVVAADILNDINGKTLFAEEYSKALFADLDGDVRYSDSFLDDANNDSICFVERRELMPYADKITAMTVYRWNRTYPWDKKLDLLPEDCDLRLVESTDIEGYSHEKITKEIYEK